MTGVYVHIPFCKSKCFYCDFLSFACDNQERPDGGLPYKYIHALTNEINQTILPPVDTIFIGGGTPTMLPVNLLSILLENIRAANCRPYKTKIEFTIEANPESLDEEKLKVMRFYGVNRLSIGLQSTDNFLLKTIDRTHTFDDFLEKYILAKKYFNNINIDLIYGLPHQDINIWIQTLKTVIDLQPAHISCYGLTIEENNPLYNALPGDEPDRAMYAKAIETLGIAGYTHYEISNFAKPNFMCLHNINCWECREYKGFGLGTHSFINNKRFNNTCDINEYIKGDFSPKNCILLSKEESISEAVILGLRLIKGIEFSDFYKRYGVNPQEKYKSKLEKLADSGLINYTTKKISLTYKGIDLSNLVFGEFL